jgi:glutathione S-transferase
MTTNALKLYHDPSSPNSRRVRIFLAEKGLTVPLVPIDLGKGEQQSEAYRAINPRRVGPTLVLDDGTAIGEVPAIWRYFEETYATPQLLGSTPKDKALVTVGAARAGMQRFKPTWLCQPASISPNRVRAASMSSSVPKAFM